MFDIIIQKFFSTNLEISQGAISVIKSALRTVTDQRLLELSYSDVVIDALSARLQESSVAV
jgi:hypothetical protein